jgi:hypothetical protein
MVSESACGAAQASGIDVGHSSDQTANGGGQGHCSGVRVGRQAQWYGGSATSSSCRCVSRWNAYECIRWRCRVGPMRYWRRWSECVNHRFAASEVLDRSAENSPPFNSVREHHVAKRATTQAVRVLCPSLSRSGCGAHAARTGLGRVGSSDRREWQMVAGVLGSRRSALHGHLVCGYLSGLLA